MKKKGTAFTIPEPCEEGWNNMKPVEKGRYCSSCEKVVVDFTAMSDFQILDFMQKSKDPVCGRMSSRQIDKVMYPVQASNYSSFSLRALVLGTALSTFSALDASAQEKKGEVVAQPVEVEHVETYKGQVEPHRRTDETTQKFMLIVVDQNTSQRLEGVAVGHFSGDGKLLKTYATDEKGKVEMSFTKNMITTDYILISRSGYSPVTLKLADMQTVMSVKLVEEPVLFEGLIVPVEE